MGSSSSKVESTKKVKTFAESIKSSVEEEFYRRAMLQREVQMAVNIAKARDNLYIFGSVWLTFVSGITVAAIMRRPIPHVASVPVVLGAIVLGNVADMAYGNKFARVNKEAEFILNHERARFVPFPQAPFAKFYTAEERSVLYDPATAVGDMPPFGAITRAFVPKTK